MGIFKSVGGMDDAFGEFVSFSTSVSFGNIGFSSSACAKAPIDWQHKDYVEMRVTCQSTTSISSIMSSGMMLDYEFPGGQMDAVHDCYYDDKIDPALMTWEMRQFRKSNFE